MKLWAEKPIVREWTDVLLTIGAIEQLHGCTVRIQLRPDGGTVTTSGFVSVQAERLSSSPQGVPLMVLVEQPWPATSGATLLDQTHQMALELERLISIEWYAQEDFTKA